MSETGDRGNSLSGVQPGKDPQLLRPARGVWLGVLAFVISLTGTELLSRQSVRGWAVLLLVGAGVLAVLAWYDTYWVATFPASDLQSRGVKSRSSRTMLSGAVVLGMLSHLAFFAAPDATFGVAGWLWVAAIVLVITAAIATSRRNDEPCATAPWSRWEIVVIATIALGALLLRVWNLRDVPFNIYPDEVMTGSVAERAYLNGPPHAPVFSTLWGDIELPALWFAIVAAVLKVGGIGLGIVRLPAALFGAATVLPFYGFIRCAWGRTAAIAGASIMAFSAANVHYSRMALNNIATPFFWTLCFFFLIRGLRSRELTHWALAGLAAGLSEHFYYGTRLLPFILVAFIAYLFAVQRREACSYLQHIGWLVAGYLVGFGPLLSYFLTHPHLYYGRGAGLMTWNRLPASWNDLQQMWNTLWPIMSDNLLGISTQSAQDIMYYAPLLLPAEAALLVLGVGLLIRRWQHPAAFLVLFSGIAVLFVGGTLVLYPNSSPPMLAHWTPAFPFFYVAIAIPIGDWTASTTVLTQKSWIRIGVVAAGLLVLGYANIRFYFFNYHADPENLKNDRYKRAQTLYDIQTVQSRYMGVLGNSYRVIVVGKSPYPYDSEITRYLVQGQEYIPAYDPQTQSVPKRVAGKGLAFLFFPGNEQYDQSIREQYPGGTAGEVRNQLGQHLFHTYVVVP